MHGAPPGNVRPARPPPFWNVTVLVRRFFFLMIRRPPRSTLDRSSAASDVYKRQDVPRRRAQASPPGVVRERRPDQRRQHLSLIHISEPTRQAEISYAVFCLKK